MVVGVIGFAVAMAMREYETSLHTRALVVMVAGGFRASPICPLLGGDRISAP